MVDVNDVEVKIDELFQVADESLKRESESHYLDFQSQVEQVEGLAREAFQAKLDTMFWPILEKLEEGRSLTAARNHWTSITLSSTSAMTLIPPS